MLKLEVFNGFLSMSLTPTTTNFIWHWWNWNKHLQETRKSLKLPKIIKDKYAICILKLSLWSSLSWSSFPSLWHQLSLMRGSQSLKAPFPIVNALESHSSYIESRDNGGFPNPCLIFWIDLPWDLGFLVLVSSDFFNKQFQKDVFLSSMEILILLDKD